MVDVKASIEIRIIPSLTDNMSLLAKTWFHRYYIQVDSTKINPKAQLSIIELLYISPL